MGTSLRLLATPRRGVANTQRGSARKEGATQEESNILRLFTVTPKALWLSPLRGDKEAARRPFGFRPFGAPLTAKALWLSPLRGPSGVIYCGPKALWLSPLRGPSGVIYCLSDSYVARRGPLGTKEGGEADETYTFRCCCTFRCWTLYITSRSFLSYWLCQ